MKKIFITPASLTIQLGSRDALLQSVSSDDISSGGGTGEGGVTEGDVKENKNLWDEEW